MSIPEIDAVAVERRAPTALPDNRFVRLKVVLAICGMSRTSMYDAIRKGDFPAPIKINSRSSAWVMSEIQQWLRGCIETNRAKPDRLVDAPDTGDR